MARPYSMDLREPLIAAVKHDRQSRRQAANRFGVAISTAIHWINAMRRRAPPRPVRWVATTQPSSPTILTTQAMHNLSSRSRVNSAALATSKRHQEPNFCEERLREHGIMSCSSDSMPKETAQVNHPRQSAFRKPGQRGSPMIERARMYFQAPYL